MTPATRWITAIVGLLSANVIASVGLAVVAATGKTQIIPEYYDRAVHYDDEIDQAARNRVLGWRTCASISGASIVVDVRDKAGAVVHGRVHVNGYQRAHADDKVDMALAADVDGVYRGSGRSLRRGIYDLTIVVDDDDRRYIQQVAVEAR